MMVSIPQRGFAFVAALAVLAGCGGDSGKLPRAEVTGTVTVDGNPVNVGTIIFRPDSGRAGRGRIENGEIIETSTYGVDDGIVLGNHKIGIQPITRQLKPAESRMEDSGTNSRKNDRRFVPEFSASTDQVLTSVRIPAKYRYPDRSGLTAEIVDGTNELVLELRSK